MLVKIRRGVHEAFTRVLRSVGISCAGVGPNLGTSRVSATCSIVMDLLVHSDYHYTMYILGLCAHVTPWSHGKINMVTLIMKYLPMGPGPKPKIGQDTTLHARIQARLQRALATQRAAYQRILQFAVQLVMHVLLHLATPSSMRELPRGASEGGPEFKTP
eukprot:jgi/Botrbrau1/17177/Bobra.0157s0068.1